ncbi:MAG: CBS domain-containing protein [Dehalococcoidia bacterium]|jgi:CBS domain-containing protein|uniref:CBS domain-containing protein n=1 Tax=Candidatus Amarobacter glycogenicus TaxID=3140699 RepID=UPI002A0C9954|nr:CBS domain-containing protein [Dehalococcoidia bacterium]MBK6561397.1 CBS domain-containing protein [Dehalococcoidia bacterium]MBK7127243.1 CBS domain-containing protein [Dehalococcoidia bacterium]MBK7327814.1 CBS domain-containing protein [Dehalococcoidia bacterium]MBK9343052.1 CBS domain-containing protein [Dehalococcoidia bacterium]
MFGLVSSVLAEKGRHVYTVGKAATVAEAVREMNEKGVGALLVMDGHKPAGIFTERDVLRRIVDADRDPALIRVAEVMTRQLVTIGPESRIDEAMGIMTERRFRHLPVLDAGEVVGMVSSGDLMRWVTMNQEDSIRQMTEYINGRA